MAQGVSPAALDAVGVVAIGRNEGERLRACLTALTGGLGRRFRTVYVDSGSTDASVALATSLGVETVHLDMSIPFTAARARNAGVERLRELHPDLRYVHVIDGDCEMVAGWMETAAAFLEAHPEVAIVCGRRRERYPERSIYNLLCDMEWEGPSGDVKACGGDSLIRLDAFEGVRGFRPDLIAGEEPELCVRLRRAGWRIHRLDAEMCLHDADMTRFGQWWKRSVRAGHAFAEGAALHGAPPERHCVRNVLRSVGWGLVLPLAILAGAVLVGPGALATFAVYPVQLARIALRGARDPRRNWIYATFMVLSRFSELRGNAQYVVNRLRGGPRQLIEYK
jgi:GT2 family glycosyltransferase